MGGDGLNDFVGQVFDEDQGSNEEISLGNIVLEGRVIVGITQLFDQVAADFNGDFGVIGIDGPHSRREGTLILGL